MKIKKIFKTAIVGFMALIVAIWPANSHAQEFNDDDDFELIKNLEIFHTLMQNVRIMYVDEVSSGELIKTAMDKMLESIDPYTVYYPESLVEDVRFMHTGGYAGVGIEVAKIADTYTVTSVIKDTPADKSGILIGDIITAINGSSLDGKNHDEMEILLKGQPGTNANLSILRGGKAMSLQMKRAIIQIPSVTYYGEIAPKTGYINLSSFTQDCGKEFKDAFMKLKTDKKIEKLVIDLRHNPGGLLIEAVNIVNLFVNKGETVVDMRGRVSEWNKVFKCENAALDTEIPIVVLVNSNSASAAEIVSGALQDLDRAVVIGEKTYGKGLVQSTKDLIYNSKMKITTAKYYIPSGRCIQKLDYSNKDSLGKASTITESQYMTFKTKNGRPVKDAGGIMPDILVSSDTMSYFVENLLNENIIFNYATEYRQKHSEAISPEEFKISDADLMDFKKWAGQSIYSYESPIDKSLKTLEQQIKQEYPEADAKKMLLAVHTELMARRTAEFETYKEQIRLALGSEIIKRYYYDNGVIRYTLHNDPFVAKGLEILDNAVLYQKTLSGK